MMAGAFHGPMRTPRPARFVFGAAALAAALAACATAAPPRPAEGARTDAAALFEALDIASFRNSVGPRREPGQRRFADLGVAVTDATADRAESHRPGDWLYALTVLARGDANGDGAPDVTVCFEDRALNGGTYNTSTPLLLQDVGGRLVALSFEPDVDCGRGGP